MLRATTACTFSASQLPKVVRTWCALYILTSKSAWRHNGVQLFIAHLPRCLRTRRFSEPTFQPSGATKPRKNTMFCDFPTYSRTCIFFLLIFSLLTLLPAGFFFISPYCLWLLNFLRPNQTVGYSRFLSGRRRHHKLSVFRPHCTADLGRLSLVPWIITHDLKQILYELRKTLEASKTFCNGSALRIYDELHLDLHRIWSDDNSFAYLLLSSHH